MTANNLWNIFKEIFPNLAAECTAYYMAGPNMIKIRRNTERIKGWIFFKFKGFNEWTLEMRR